MMVTSVVSDLSVLQPVQMLAGADHELSSLVGQKLFIVVKLLWYQWSRQDPGRATENSISLIAGAGR